MIRRSTWILLLVFVLLLAVTVYIQTKRDNSVEVATPTTEGKSPFLVIPEGKDIVGLRILNDSGSVVDLNRQIASDDWIITNQVTGIVDNDRINSALSSLINVTIETKLKADTPLDVLGLASPAYTITLNISDGNQLDVYVGDVTIASNSYYSQLGDGLAMAVTKSGLDTVIGFLEDPPVLIPTSTPMSTTTQTPQP